MRTNGEHLLRSRPNGATYMDAKMSFKHVDTAADLVRYGASLKIECTGCGAARTLSSLEVVKTCGSGQLDAIRRRLKCGRCGMKAAQLVVLPPV